MNPKCANMCTYPNNTDGRRPLFCSQNCAKRFSETRKRLLRDLAEMDAALAEAPPHARLSSALRQRRAHLSWHLARYGGEPTSSQSSEVRDTK